MKVKKILAILLVFISFFILSGCQIDFDENGDLIIVQEPSNAEEIPSTNLDPFDPIITPNEENAPQINNEENLEPSLDFSEERLMSTRSIIRESNIFITAKKYDRTFTNSLILAETSVGSGVVYRSDANYYYAITNYHVVEKGTYYKAEYTVESLNGTKFLASLVITSREKDLAVIKFPKNSVIIPLINIMPRVDIPLEPDEFLLAVGNPSGLQNIVTFGEFIQMSRIQNVTFQVINHSVLIYPGNSGGALTDIYGNLVGINTWGDTNDDENNFAIPVKEVYNFLLANQLI